MSACLSKKCSFCEGGLVVFCEKMYDDRYGYPGMYDLFRCDRCGCVCVDADFNNDQLVELYSKYYPRSKLSVEAYRVPVVAKGFSSWLNGDRSMGFQWIEGPCKVLDIGCGFGESLGYYRAIGCDAYGVEADKNIEKVAKHFGYNVHVGIFSAELYEPNSFDAVVMSQVIEHVKDVRGALSDISQVLRPGGKVVLTYPNVEGWGRRVFGRKWINWHVPYHLNFLTCRSAKLLAGEVGFSVELYRTITSSDWLYFQLLHMLDFPLEGEKSNFWSGKRGNGFVRKVVVALYRMKFIHLISRVFDKLGLGDNAVVVLNKL